MTKRYKLNLKQVLFVALVAAVGVSGCKKSLDINQNPNGAANVDPTLLLPTTQAAISQVVGNSFQAYGNIWAQYWTQSPVASQYKSLDQYAPVNTDFNGPWSNIYRVALINNETILKNPASSNNLKGIAYLMKAYAFQLATDAFGSVPLSQALQPTLYTSPKYDTQQTVYDSIFVYINKALPLLKAAGPATPIAGQDMIFQGDMTQWIAFANTFELRAYLRLAKANPTAAQAGIAALYATKPAFLTADATITYTATGGNENPFYNEEVALNKSTQNVVASSTIVNAMTTNNDPRLGKFFKLYNTVGDSLESIPQGSFQQNINKHVSPASPLVGATANDPASATAPVKLLSAAESYFLQAEAIARGWATGDLATLYQAGITASFTATGAGAPATYISTAPDGLPALTAAATPEAKIKAIITQKYYAMCGFQGFEAWTEWRRTGYPTFIIQSLGSTIDPGQMPLRMLYPNSELTSNLNYPGTIPIYTPVYWGM
jgi:hypothetical protein